MGDLPPAPGIRPRPDPAAVLATADMLLREPRRWGLLGVEFVFYHQFFNTALQKKLRALRLELYGSPTPPLSMTLEAATALLPGAPDREARLVLQAMHAVARSGDRGLLSILRRQEMRRAWQDLLHKFDPASLLLAPCADAAERAALRPRAAAAAGSLDGLARRYRVASGSLHLALVCGTPPVPVDVESGQEPAYHPAVGWYPSIYVRVFSAKVHDVKRPYSDTTSSFVRARPSANLPPIEARWRTDTFPPCLELRATPYQGVVPRPSRVQQRFKAERVGARFYDSQTKVKDLGEAVAAWTVATLRLRCGLGLRAAMRRWAMHQNLENPFSGNRSKTATHEERTRNRQIRAVCARIQAIARLLDADDPGGLAS